jgi:hypothetical protein
MTFSLFEKTRSSFFAKSSFISKADIFGFFKRSIRDMHSRAMLKDV